MPVLFKKPTPSQNNFIKKCKKFHFSLLKKLKKNRKTTTATTAVFFRWYTCLRLPPVSANFMPILCLKGYHILVINSSMVPICHFSVHMITDSAYFLPMFRSFFAHFGPVLPGLITEVSDLGSGHDMTNIHHANHDMGRLENLECWLSSLQVRLVVSSSLSSLDCLMAAW